MPDHLRSEAKDFLDRIAFVVSSDETVTKSHIRYLEGRMIKLVGDAGSDSLVNDTHPDFQRLPRPTEPIWTPSSSRCDSCSLFWGSTCSIRRGRQSRLAAPAQDDSVFTFSTAGATATARETEDGFVVLAGSTARKARSGTFPAGYLALESALSQEGNWSTARPPTSIISPSRSCSQAPAPRLRSSPRAVGAARSNGRS